MQRSIPQLEIHPFYGQAQAQRRGLRQRLLAGLLPLHTYVPLRQELQLARLRLRQRQVARHYRDRRDLLVNLGAGALGRAGWINVDAVAAPGVNCVYDCRTRLPFASHSVRGIFCEHFFEHIDYTEEAPAFLAECWRVLQPGGVLRLIVPDAERYLRAYCAEGWDELDRLRGLDREHTDPYLHSRYHTKIELINAIFRQGCEHKYAYDYDTLAFLLTRYGFQQVQRQSFGRSRLAELCIDQPRRAAESLYVEAIP